MLRGLPEAVRRGKTRKHTRAENSSLHEDSTSRHSERPTAASAGQRRGRLPWAPRDAPEVPRQGIPGDLGGSVPTSPAPHPTCSPPHLLPAPPAPRRRPPVDKSQQPRMSLCSSRHLSNPLDVLRVSPVRGLSHSELPGASLAPKTAAVQGRPSVSPLPAVQVLGLQVRPPLLVPWVWEHVLTCLAPGSKFQVSEYEHVFISPSYRLRRSSAPPFSLF